MKFNKLKTGAITSYIAVILNSFVALLFTPFFVKTLGKSDYGIYVLIGSFIGYITLMDFGFGNTLVRYIAKFRTEGRMEEEHNVFSLCFFIYVIISLISLLVCIGINSQLSTLFKNGLSLSEISTMKKMFLILIINVVTMFPLQAFSSALKGYEYNAFLNILSVARLVVRTLVLIALLSMRFGVICVVVVDTVLNLLFGLITVFFVFIRMKYKLVKPHYTKDFLHEIFMYSFYLFLISMSGQIIWRLGNIVLGMYKSSASIAVYNVGMQFPTYYITIASAISIVFVPRIMSMVVRKISNAEMSDFIIRASRLQFYLLGFVLCGFSLLGRKFIFLWMGKDYSAAWLIAMIVMIPETFSLLGSIPSSLLVARNLHRFKALAYTLHAVFIAVVIFFLVPRLGIYGAAIGTALGMMIGEVIVINIYFHKRLELDMIQFWKDMLIKMLPFMLLSILLCLPLLLLKSNSWSVLLTQGVIYTIVYIVIMVKFCTNKYERDLVVLPLKRLFRRKA